MCVELGLQSILLFSLKLFNTCALLIFAWCCLKTTSVCYYKAALLVALLPLHTDIMGVSRVPL